jgi:hypothetical protein
MAPQLVLRVVSGAAVGRTFRLSDGVTVVGRAAECSIVIDDPTLSRQHFKLIAHADRCEAIDLGSRAGLLVNGRALLRALLHVGDKVSAGEVVFCVESERLTPLEVYADAPATLSPEAPAPPDGSLLAAVRAIVPNEREGLSVYAVVDGARAFDLAFTGRLMGHKLYTLFAGELAALTAHVGPLLVSFEGQSAFLERWVSQVGCHAGVLLRSNTDLESLYTHLRQIFIVNDEDGQEYFFRFYDPRVLRTFLPTCRSDELAEVFGPVDEWIVENPEATGYLRFRRESAGLTSVDLKAPLIHDTGRKES